jgi:hypothetical protein
LIGWNRFVVFDSDQSSRLQSADSLLFRDRDAREDLPTRQDLPESPGQIEFRAVRDSSKQRPQVIRERGAVIVRFRDQLRGVTDAPGNNRMTCFSIARLT